MFQPSQTTPATARLGEATAGAAWAPPPSTTLTSPSNPYYNGYLPIPIRTIPCPTFHPTNGVSLIQLAYTWLKEVFFPPPAEPSVIHGGVWDPATRSVHITNPLSIRTLWDHGFFGKGSLSRSEPNWLKRELSRRGQASNVSEQRTESRRDARRLAKWERAKTELEALEQQRLAEARANAETPEDVVAKPLPTEPKPLAGPVEVTEHSTSLVESVIGISAPQQSQSLGSLNSQAGPAKPVINNVLKFSQLPAPVGPAELLALPNSLDDTISAVGRNDAAPAPQPNGHGGDKPVNGHATPAKLTNDSNERVREASAPLDKASASGHTKTMDGIANGVSSPTPSVGSTSGASEPAPSGTAPEPLKRRKSVRFSSTVESTTFQHHDPPSPRHSTINAPKPALPVVPNGVASPFPSSVQPTQVSAPIPTLEFGTPGEVENKEHYQLAPVEAFFLVFSLGVLSVVDPVTQAPIPTKDLLTLFRAYSYFPPLDVGSSLNSLRPQDPFLVDYAVYHHFRSLGWVPRPGMKFGVDLLLYERGPAYNHSHLGAIIMPSFSDERWKNVEHEEPQKTWSWLMGINRVMAHVLKGLVLVYVDIPPPSVFDEAMRKGGLTAVLKKYAIREVMVRRFSVNRNR